MITINPKILSGDVLVPSSKSIGHRLLICAGLAQGVSRVSNVHMSNDIKMTMEALAVLGARFKPLDAYTWEVVGIGGQSNGVQMENEPLRLACGESGSTLRFMIPVATAVCQHTVFTGENRLVERPIDEYFPIFKRCGAEIDYPNALPLTVKGNLRAGHYQLSGSISSQYTSGMLLAAPLIEGDTSIEITTPLESRAYVDLTIDAMAEFGVVVERSGYDLFKVKGPALYKPQQLSVEGDYSQAAFWIVAGLIGKLPIRLKGMNKDSRQGDRYIVDLVEDMGAQLFWEEEGLLVLPSKTMGRIIDASQCPDLVPILAVLCTLSEGESRIVNGQRLRIKESDRITATVTELQKLGAVIIETEDGMIIQGDPLQDFVSAELDSWNDHRIAMAIAIAATRAEGPIGLKDHLAVNKSYPKFFEDYVQLGGEIIG